VIPVKPSRKIHPEHPQDEPGREHVDAVQPRTSYQPKVAVEDGENDDDGDPIASKGFSHSGNLPELYSTLACESVAGIRSPPVRFSVLSAARLRPGPFGAPANPLMAFGGVEAN